MRVWWLEKLPARRASFVWEFIPIQTKTASSILLETVMFHYRGATQIDCFSPLCSHTIICAGRITGPDPAGTYCWFGASLESPFLKCSHTAIPPPAALCNVRDSEYSSFSSVSLCFLYCTSLQSKSQSQFEIFPIFSCSTAGSIKTGLCKWRRQTAPLHHYCSHAASTFSNDRSPPYKSSALPTVT